MHTSCSLFCCQCRARSAVCSKGGKSYYVRTVAVIRLQTQRGASVLHSQAPWGKSPGGTSETPTDCGCAPAREGLGLDAPSLSSLVERERERERERNHNHGGTSPPPAGEGKKTRSGGLRADPTPGKGRGISSNATAETLGTRVNKTSGTKRTTTARRAKRRQTATRGTRSEGHEVGGADGPTSVRAPTP